MNVPAQNQKYENFIVRYDRNTHGGSRYESDEGFQIINDIFGILYVPVSDVAELELSSYSYSSIPRCYTYMDIGALNTSGATRLHEHPYLKLQGKGTLVAIIGTIIPPFVIISLISAFYHAFRDNYLVSQMLEGMQAGVGAVIASVTYEMGCGIIKKKDNVATIVMIVAFIAACVLGINVIYIVIASGVFGVIRTIWNRRRKRV